MWVYSTSSLDCKDCVIYDPINNGCNGASIGHFVPCDGDPPVVETKYRAENNQWDIISIGQYLGDINMLNANFDKFFIYTNNCMYWAEEYIDNEPVPVSSFYDSLINVGYEAEDNDRLGYVSSIYIFSAADIPFDSSKKFVLLSRTVNFHRINNFTFYDEADPEKTPIIGYAYTSNCYDRVCSAFEYYVYSSFTLEDFFKIKPRDDTYSQSLESYLLKEGALYGRFFLLSEKDFNNLTQTVEELQADHELAQKAIVLNSLQQLYYSTLEMITTIELEELQDDDIYYQSDQTTLLLNSKITDIQARVKNFPIIRDVEFTSENSIHPNQLAFFNSQIDVFCGEVKTNLDFDERCDHDRKTLSLSCFARNNTNVLIPSKTREAFDTEIEITDTWSLLVRSKTYITPTLYNSLEFSGGNDFYLANSGFEPHSKYQYGYDAEFFLIFKDALNLPYNIDDSFKINFTYNQYITGERYYENQTAYSYFNVTPVTIILGEPSPVNLQTEENEFFGLQVYPLTNVRFEHLLVDEYNIYDASTAQLLEIYPFPNFKINYENCNAHQEVNRSLESPAYYSIFDPDFDPWGIFAIYYVNAPEYDNITLTFPIGIFANYERQSPSDLSININKPNNNDIINYLYSLNNRIDDLQEEILSIEDVLEEITKPEELSFWDYFQTVMSIVDMADFAVNTGKAIYSLTRNAIRFLSSKLSTVKNVAEQFGQILEEGQSLKGIYNPVEAINNGAIYNYFSGHKISKFENKELKVESLISDLDNIFDHNGILKTDARLMMTGNSAAYAAISNKIFKEYEDLLKNDIAFSYVKTPFGEVSVHKSPIDILNPIGGKFISDAIPQSVTSSFLSNKHTKYPFHTSFSSSTFEMNAKNEAIICKRFGGIAEASTVGPTNVKNPKVKIGIVKFDYRLKHNAETGEKSMTFLNWDETEKQAGQYYSPTDVDKLYESFVSRKNYLNTKSYSTDKKWQIIHDKCAKKYSSRNIIDSVAVGNPLYMKSLDRLFDYNHMYNGFNYNLWNKNCQSFVKSYASLASKGVSAIKIKDSNYQDFVNGFYDDFVLYNNDLIEAGYYTKVFEIEDNDSIKIYQRLAKQLKVFI